jgi:hypothetical protein
VGIFGISVFVLLWLQQTTKGRSWVRSPISHKGTSLSFFFSLHMGMGSCHMCVSTINNDKVKIAALVAAQKTNTPEPGAFAFCFLFVCSLLASRLVCLVAYRSLLFVDQDQG